MPIEIYEVYSDVTRNWGRIYVYWLKSKELKIKVQRKMKNIPKTYFGAIYTEGIKW